MPFQINSKPFSAIDAIVGEKVNPLIAGVCAFASELNNPQIQTFTFQTSGTTGKPKTIQFTKKQIFASAKQTLEFFNLKQDNSVLLALPLDTVAAKMMIARALIGHLNLVVAKPTLNPLLGFMDAKKIHFAAFSPAQIDKIIKDVSTKVIFDKIDTVIIGGAPLTENLRPVLKQQKNALFETYGATETLSHVAVKKVSVSNSSSFKAISKAISFAMGEKNNLIIHAKQICDLPVITNDVVRLIDDKQFVWKGRLDNVINSSGIKIHPEEIEQIVLKNFKAMPEFYITALQEKTFGERPALVTEKQLESNMLNKINKHLHPHQKIKKIIYDKIEKNENLKTIRKKY